MLAAVCSLRMDRQIPTRMTKDLDTEYVNHEEHTREEEEEEEEEERHLSV